MNNHWVLRTRMDNRKKRAPGRRLVRKALDAHAVSADQKVRSMRAEVWVSLPEPAVGVFTTAGTCQGRLRRHS
jgi:hypothetical protein